MIRTPELDQLRLEAGETIDRLDAQGDPRGADLAALWLACLNEDPVIPNFTSVLGVLLHERTQIGEVDGECPLAFTRRFAYRLIQATEPLDDEEETIQ
jgi:hypothetical protein